MKASKETGLRCAHCHQLNAASAKYCNGCGARMEHVEETVPVLGMSHAATAAPGYGQPSSPVPGFGPGEGSTEALPPFDADPGEPTGGGRRAGINRRRTVAVVAAAAAVVVVGAAALVLLVFSGLSAEQQAVLTTQNAAEDLMTDLEGASDTADLRRVGEAAAVEAAALRAVAVTDPGSPEAEMLAGYSQLWDALTGLADIDGDRLGDWPAVSDELTLAASAISEAAADELIAGQDPTVATEAAIANVDRLIAEAETAIATWRAEDAAVAAANDEVRAERAALESYSAAGSAIFDDYVRLRNDTGDFGDRIREVGVTYGEAFDYFSRGEADRRDLANELGALNYSDGLAAVHARMASVITAGADAMGAAYEGIDDTYDCNSSPFSFEYCDYRDSYGWQRFQDESDRITGDFDAARAEWERAVEDRLASLEEQPAPIKPVV